MLQKLGKYEILTKKEEEEFYSKLRLQFGIEKKLEGVLLKRKNRILLTTHEMLKKLKNLPIQRVGLYIAKVDEKSVKLSIEGSQLFGKYANKNIIELTEKEMEKWMKGFDLSKKLPRGIYLIKFGPHFIGVGTSDGKKLKNMVPKERRFPL